MHNLRKANQMCINFIVHGVLFRFISHETVAFRLTWYLVETDNSIHNCGALFVMYAITFYVTNECKIHLSQPDQ